MVQPFIRRTAQARDDSLRYEAGSRLFSVLGRGNQGVRPNPLGVWVLRCEHRDQVERLPPDVNERVRDPGRHFRDVRCLDGKCLVADPVLSAAFEQYVRLFGVMHM
jgi:hypothetical protein